MKKIVLSFIFTLSSIYAQDSNSTRLDSNITQKESNSTKKISKLEKLISFAKSKIGSPYLYSHAGPDKFDCSGFVYFVFTSNGIKIPRSSLNQAQTGTKLTREEIKKGDMLFFDTGHRGHVNHSGVYLGDGKFIHATSGKAKSVTISSLDKGFYPDKFCWGIRKIEVNATATN